MDDVVLDVACTAGKVVFYGLVAAAFAVNFGFAWSHCKHEWSRKNG